MHTRSWILALAAVTGLGWATHAQSPQKTATLPPVPATKADVGPWDAMIVRRAEKILASPAQWNRADTGDCDAGATTFSISCALDKANQEAAGISEGTAAVSGDVGSSIRSDCRFHSAGSGQEGSCGMLFGEVPIITIAHTAAITTGVWRKDMAPSEVWAGKMSNAQYPVLHEAEKLVGVVAANVMKYDDRLVDYNNDPSTTFAAVQAFFKALEDRVITNGAADLDDATRDVEIETYANGTGLIRTYRGWFPVVNYAVQGSSPRFQIDLKAEVPPNDLDRQIIQRAAALITSDAVWNRADNRKCPADAKTVSLYCAEERATIEVAGGFHHRRPALELVRVIVEERTKKKKYQHRLMDYNNDPTTTLADVKSLFAAALAQIK
jgi:roadblock/LC7 domain-containing protein